MGLGEKLMRNWGYAASGTLIGIGLFLMILGILTVVVIKGSVTEEFKNDTMIFAIFMIIFAIGGVIVGALALTKIYKTNQLYLKVGSKASVELTGPKNTVSTTTPAPRKVVSQPPPQSTPPPTTEQSNFNLFE